MGSTLIVILTGMEIGLLAAAEMGTDVQLFFWHSVPFSYSCA
jgi:hypothetical protein